MASTTSAARAVEIDEIKAHFAELVDPRSPVNRWHVLEDVIVISICGVIAGADGPAAIEVWAQSQVDWLRQHLQLPHGIPTHDTIRRVLERLSPAAFQKCFASWLSALIGDHPTRHLAIDGKSLRRAHDQARGWGPLHLVSVWATEHSLTLAQVATSQKSNEITAIPEVLDLIDVKGAVVTIDAMGTQKAIAQKIIDQQGDYILPVKGNQGTLEQAVQEHFDELLENDFAGVKVSTLETEERQHGRLERRTYYLVDVPPALRGREEWAGLKTLGLVIRTREIKGVETGDVQPYICSVRRDVNLFAKAVRGHWSQENTCHWTLDMTFREDESRVRNRRLAETLAWLKRFALGLLKRHPNQKLSLVMKRRKAGWSTDFLTEVLCGTIS